MFSERFMMQQATYNLDEFKQLVLDKGCELYRDLAWRNISDPYGVWISEVMLQQTQVVRVDGRWQRWMLRFPTVESLAQAPVADVLDEWQGMGYNRRALSLQKAAQQIVDHGFFPDEVDQLVKLPGIGPATAGGIVAFAHNKHALYLETNVRTVFLHELYPEAEAVPDKVLIPHILKTCPASAAQDEPGPRGWYYALLDYGAYLKKTVPNPSRRSKTYSRQSKFEGSHRQKRAEVIRLLLDEKTLETDGLEAVQIQEIISNIELSKNREPVEIDEIFKVLDELVKEGFIEVNNDKFVIKS